MAEDDQSNKRPCPTLPDERLEPSNIPAYGEESNSNTYNLPDLTLPADQSPSELLDQMLAQPRVFEGQFQPSFFMENICTQAPSEIIV